MVSVKIKVKTLLIWKLMIPSFMIVGEREKFSSKWNQDFLKLKLNLFWWC